MRSLSFAPLARARIVQTQPSWGLHHESSQNHVTVRWLLPRSTDGQAEGPTDQPMDGQTDGRSQFLSLLQRTKLGCGEMSTRCQSGVSDDDDDDDAMMRRV